MNEWMKSFSDDIVFTSPTLIFGRFDIDERIVRIFTQTKNKRLLERFETRGKWKEEKTGKCGKFMNAAAVLLRRWWCESIYGKTKAPSAFPTFIPGLLRDVHWVSAISWCWAFVSWRSTSSVCSIERYGRGVAKISVCVSVWAITPPPGLIAVH